MPANSTNSLDVAAAIVDRLHPVQIVKLQKLVFYAAGEYAALTGQPLFPEDIEAWDLGPVVCNLWKTQKSNESQNDIDHSRLGDSSKLNDLAQGCVNSVVAKYGAMSGAQLIDLTHTEPAWIESYVPGQARTKIPFDLLVKSFRRKPPEARPSDELLNRIFA
jgi:uncharacterized phage-associated protein